MRNFGRCALLLGALLVVGCAEEDGEDTEQLEEDAGASMADDAGLDARVDARVDSALSAEPDAAEVDAGGEPEPDASTLDAMVMDAAAVDAGGDAAATDAGKDGGVDAGSDAGKDGGTDAGSDAGKDGGLADAGSDAGKDSSTPDASTPDASTPDASVASGTFSSVYLILSGNCAGCHGSNGGLSMANKQRAYDELVGGPMGPSMGLAEGAMCSAAGRRRVIPFDAPNSLIIQKLSGSPPCGNAMPPGDSLPPASINEIRAWITAGALNN